MTLDDLPLELRQPRAAAAASADLPAARRRRVGRSADRLGIRQASRSGLPFSRSPHQPGAAPPAKPAAGEDWNAEFVAYERQRLIDALNEANGNKSVAARLLGMPRSTFFSKMKKHGVL